MHECGWAALSDFMISSSAARVFIPLVPVPVRGYIGPVHTAHLARLEHCKPDRTHLAASAAAQDKLIIVDGSARTKWPKLADAPSSTPVASVVFKTSIEFMLDPI